MKQTTAVPHAARVTSIAGAHLLLGIVVSLAASGVFALLWRDVEDKHRHITHFDTAVLGWMHAHQQTWLLPIAKALAFMGSPPTIVGIAVAGAITGLAWRKVRGAAWTFPIAIMGAGIIIQGIKLEFHRPRPTLYHQLIPETGYSFPSGHSLIAMVVYGLIGFFTLHLVHRQVARWVVVCLTALIIVGVGVSRMYVQVHYPSDVLAGWAAGVPWLLTCIWVHEGLVRRYEGAGEAVLTGSH